MKFTEDNLQAACVQWFRLKYRMSLIWATPNGGRRNAREAGRMKAQGVLAGVPDLFIPEPRVDYHGLFIELKSPGKYPTPIQSQMLIDLDARGYRATVCRTIDEFRAVVDAYFARGRR